MYSRARIKFRVVPNPKQIHNYCCAWWAEISFSDWDFLGLEGIRRTAFWIRRWDISQWHAETDRCEVMSLSIGSTAPEMQSVGQKCPSILWEKFVRLVLLLITQSHRENSNIGSCLIATSLRFGSSRWFSMIGTWSHRLLSDDLSMNLVLRMLKLSKSNIHERMCKERMEDKGNSYRLWHSLDVAEHKFQLGVQDPVNDMYQVSMKTCIWICFNLEKVESKECPCLLLVSFLLTFSNWSTSTLEVGSRCWSCWRWFSLSNSYALWGFSAAALP